MKKVTLKYLGGFSFEISTENQSLLIDPNFSSKILARKRSDDHCKNGQQVKQPKLILFSSKSYFHTDIEALKFFSLDTSVIMPSDMQNWFEKFWNHPQATPKNRNENNETGQTEYICGEFHITAIPTLRWGRRWLPMAKASVNSYIIRIYDQKILLSSHSPWSQELSEIQEKHKIDICLFSYSDHKILKLFPKNHMNLNQIAEVINQDHCKRYLIALWSFDKHKQKKQRDTLFQKLLKSISKDNKEGNKKGNKEKVEMLEYNQEYELGGS